jgi:Uma2 family endonuclease
MTGVDPALYSELEALPETMIGEILHGDLIASPRPRARHAVIISLLLRRLGDAFEEDRNGSSGWLIVTEPEVHLGGEVLVPDLAGWRHQTLPEIPETVAFDVTPDWVCEVISPSSGRRDRVIKKNIYGEKGVPYLWFVDPATRTLEVLRLTPDGWFFEASFAEDDVANAPPFHAFGLNLAELWRK